MTLPSAATVLVVRETTAVLPRRPRNRSSRWARRCGGPEQAAVWAYPQPHFDLGEIAFTMTTALPGRVHLSGFLAGPRPAR